VYAKYTDAGTEAFADGTASPDAWYQKRGGFRIDDLHSAQDKFTLQGDIYDSNEDGASGASQLSGANLLGRWTHTVSTDSDMSLQAYFDRTHFSAPQPQMIFAPAGILEDGLNTYDLDFQHHFRLNGRNRVVWGIGYRATHDVVDNAPSLSFFPPVLNQNLYSGFVQDEFMLRDNLYFTAGTKLEHNDYTGFEVEPDVRLQWNFRSNELLWAAISRAVRTPSRIDRDLAQPAPSTGLTILAGSSAFKSESVIAYEVGYRGQLRSELSASISTFYNSYDDVRSIQPSEHPTIPGLPFPLVFHNNVEGETYGVELASDYQPHERLRFHAGYTFLRDHLRVKPGQVDFNAALNEIGDPEQQLSVRSSIDLTSSVELDTALRWVDTLHLNNGPVIGTVPSYTDLDVRLGWRVTPSIELSVVGQNLLHDQHPEYGYPGPSRIETERSVLGRIAWRF